MQEAALEGLRNIREQGKDRALVISATGTGKTFLSAFDVKQYNPERHVIHRSSRTDSQKIFNRFSKKFWALIHLKDIFITRVTI